MISLINGDNCDLNFRIKLIFLGLWHTKAIAMLNKMKLFLCKKGKTHYIR